jgi:putative ABC transport system permease protein
MIENQNVDIAIQAKFASSPMNSIVPNDVIEKITKYVEVKSVESLLIERKRLDKKRSIVILGVTNFEIFSQRVGFNIIKGRTLDDSENELIVGSKMAKVLKLKVGDTFDFGDTKEYSIVGIYSSWLNFLNAGVLVDIKTARKISKREGKVSLAFLILKDSTKTASVVQKINREFPKLNAVEGEDFPNQIGSIKSVFYFSKIVSILTLFIAVAVLLNTFIMAIYERTKEVGILKAIGWSKKMILSVFLIESILLSFGGGLIGYLSSYPVLSIIQNNFTGVSMYIPSYPSIDIFFNVIIMCFVISVVSILFPVLYSMKIEIAKAIRHE